MISLSASIIFYFSKSTSIYIHHSGLWDTLEMGLLTKDPGKRPHKIKMHRQSQLKSLVLVYFIVLYRRHEKIDAILVQNL